MSNVVLGTYEGKQEFILELETPTIEVFTNIYAGKRFLVSLEINEFTAICPKTSLPDFGTIYIDYQPNEVCLELKSLKEYFFFYRNIGIFHENVVNKAINDLIKSCNPFYIKVRADYNIRGGIKTIVEREFGTKISS